MLGPSLPKPTPGRGTRPTTCRPGALTGRFVGIRVHPWLRLVDGWELIVDRPERQTPDNEQCALRIFGHVVGTARCAVRNTERSVRCCCFWVSHTPSRFRRLTLRSATGTPQRSVPTLTGELRQERNVYRAIFPIIFLPAPSGPSLPKPTPGRGTRPTTCRPGALTGRFMGIRGSGFKFRVPHSAPRSRFSVRC